MCRWLAYSGSPVNLEQLLYKPKHSLVAQSKHSRLGVETTNGDGFGVAWYNGVTPSRFRSVEPFWNDQNMRELAPLISASLVFAHVRASTGGAVQQTNCHPFRHERWLWMHNGKIAGFRELERELILAIDETLYPEIEGSTDSEVFFYLALTFGLYDDPRAAVARAVFVIEEAAKRRGIENAMQMTVATTDGETTWAFRYSTEHRSRSLFHSTDISTLRTQYPDNPTLHRLSDDARLIVSEPLGDLHGAWEEVPESTCLVVHRGRMDREPFAPLRA